MIVADRQNGVPLSFGSMSTVDPGTWVAGLAGAARRSVSGERPDDRRHRQDRRLQARREAAGETRDTAELDRAGPRRDQRRLQRAQFRALAIRPKGTWTDTSVTPNVVYAGTPLWRLVALADGGSAATLNLDWLGLGYNVDVSGMGVDALGADAPTTATFASSAIAGSERRRHRRPTGRQAAHPDPGQHRRAGGPQLHCGGPPGRSASWARD